jgi:predicted MFS family arabinose efflux permease
MTITAPVVEPDLAAHPPIRLWVTLLLATACGVIVANLYYAQPLIGPIAAATGLAPAAAGLVVTMTQIGYGLGLLLIVPLGDLIENRRLVVWALCLTIAALVMLSLASHALPLLAASLLVGVGAVAAQVLVPYAAHLAPPHARGRTVGNVMSGLLLGIMLARPIASLTAEAMGWHMIFVLSAAVMAVLAITLHIALPKRQPQPGPHYAALLASMWHLLRTTPVLRRSAAYHACLFAAFSLFWTTVPLLLAGPRFNLSQNGIALFALAGVAGAIVAPLAGRLADRGWRRKLIVTALCSAVAAFMLARWHPAPQALAIAVLVAAAILLDAAVSANLVVGQRAIFALGAHIRSRLNGVFMALFFAGGAAGSALGGWSYAAGGWSLTAWLGAALPAAALLLFATEPSTRSHGQRAR